MIQREELFKVNGIELFVRQKGKGAPFFWTHGLLGSIELEEKTGIIDWSQIAGFAHTIRYDVRGHGRSSSTLLGRDYQWENLVSDARMLLDQLGFRAYSLGGQSMGAVISLFLALLRPEVVKRLVLVTPPALWEEGVRHGEVYEFAAALLESEGMDRLIELMKEQHDLAGLTLLYSPEITQQFVVSLKARNPQVVKAILQGAARTNYPPRKVVRKIRIPTLILAWRDDELHPLSAAEELHQLIPGSQLQVAQSRREISHWSQRIAQFLSAPREGYP